MAQFYHDDQIRSTRLVLTDENQGYAERLYQFFSNATKQFKEREFKHGCLMCNLSAELADENENFQMLLAGHWQELSTEIARCIKGLGTEQFGLAHLSSEECADWLINAWCGSLTRMKATGDSRPLQLFLKTIFVNRT